MPGEQAPSLTPPLAEILPAWLARQRWYAGKGRHPALRRLGGFRFEDPDGEVGVETHITADLSAQPAVVYQLPLSYRAEPLPGAQDALVGTAVHSVLGRRWIYDATHDPVYVRALLDLVLRAGTSGSAGRAEGGNDLARGWHTSGPRELVLTRSAVLRGEQSNTSVVCTVQGLDGQPADPIIVKVFRILQAGDNPDVTVQAALTAAGSAQVPETVGFVTGGWLAPDHVEARARHEASTQAQVKAAVDARTAVMQQIQRDRKAAAAQLETERAQVARARERELERRLEAVRPSLHDALLADPESLLEPAVEEDDLPDPDRVPEPEIPVRELPRIPSHDEFPAFVPELQQGHLAFAQRFFPGVEDAWRVALRAAAADDDFEDAARELGAATAHIHLALAQSLGTTAPSADAKRELLTSIRGRYHAALSEVPALAEHQSSILGLIDDFSRREWGPLQRIHGDYHLGQVLRVDGRGWVAVDFEGEPLRPLSERVRPDLALRDVAGMLRSFDYAGGSVEMTHPGRSARTWVETCRAAFLDGYARATAADLTAATPTIRALELDKALYEVVYEARNRPTWLGIPSAAIDRIVADSKGLS